MILDKTVKLFGLIYATLSGYSREALVCFSYSKKWTLALELELILPAHVHYDYDSLPVYSRLHTEIHFKSFIPSPNAIYWLISSPPRGDNLRWGTSHLSLMTSFQLLLLHSHDIRDKRET